MFSCIHSCMYNKTSPKMTGQPKPAYIHTSSPNILKNIYKKKIDQISKNKKKNKSEAFF